MKFQSSVRASAQLSLLIGILAFATLNGYAADHADKTSAGFVKLLTEKYLPDGKLEDHLASMNGDKKILEYGVFAKPYSFEGGNYSVTITKYTTTKDCTNQTLTFKNNPDAIIDGVFAIIPSNSEVDKEALKKIKAAWDEFKKTEPKKTVK